MTRLEKAVSILVLAPVLPVVLMLTVWWGSLPFAPPDSLFPLLPLIGFTIGILFDIILMRKLLLRLFNLPFWALTALNIFYTVMVFGFFMGFPLFNVFVGITAVAVTARNGVVQQKDPQVIRNRARLMNRVSLGILLFVCTCSAVLALRESTICSQLQGMLNLPFRVTMGMVWGLIIVGGSLLLLSQYLFSRLISGRILKKVTA